ncbi:E3 ubiquitin/ISG15 ligase TRIM25-like isoform X2 [Esox lucius]|uniref:RING-type domain-containing protein n=1 Tax=Esox lucius TaxID=8010 RepID=A0A6Q2XII1_ESOLU|nr:E3 ubiquitin/ISG15 ligase TRIM25-like isoform X2 [Esox lucius]
MPTLHVKDLRMKWERIASPPSSSERIKMERMVSPAPSCLSMKSDKSMGIPPQFNRHTLTPDLRGIKQERADSPAPSCLSMKSDKSMGIPPQFNRDTWTPDLSPSLLTKHQFGCSVCSEVLRDPVSIPCGHSYCRQCISTYWAHPGPAGDYMCPQCSRRSRTRPELYTNSALARVIQKLQRTGFSPALPALVYAGPGDLACDICSGKKLRAVKSCLTCTASYCESHIRQHYTVPALQNHTLAEVTGGHYSGKTGKTKRIKEEGETEDDEDKENVCKKIKMAVKEEDVKIADLMRIIRELKENNLELKNISEHLEQENSVLKKNFIDLEQENSVLKKNYIDLEQENSVLKKNYIDLEQENSVLKKNFIDLKQENFVLKRISIDLEQGNSVLKKISKDLEQEISVLKKNSIDLKQENSLLKRISKDLELVNSVLKKFCYNLEQCCLELYLNIEQENSNLKHQNSNLIKEVAESTININLMHFRTTDLLSALRADLGHIWPFVHPSYYVG